MRSGLGLELTSLFVAAWLRDPDRRDIVAA
jgi:hypothetical protein